MHIRELRRYIETDARLARVRLDVEMMVDMGRRRAFWTAGVVFAVACSSLTLGATSTETTTNACVLVNVPGLGQACPTGTGLWRVPVGGGRWVTTHGGDPFPNVPYVPVTSVAGAKMPKSYYGWPLAQPQCVYDPASQFHQQVLYVRASDRPDNFARMRDGIRIMVHGSNGWLRKMAARFKRALDYRVLCAGSSVTVESVKLNMKDEDADFGAIISGLIDQGYSNPFAKYWIFYDGPSRGGAAGFGTMRPDDRAGADNNNNFGPGWAVTFNVGLIGSLKTMMHENGHNLGAVQFSAPNSNKASHCIDGEDVMCYYESGGLGERYNNSRCKIADFDCGFDDYFNPSPRKGSYLAKHWNTAAPADRFLAGCIYRTGVLETPGNSAAPVPNVVTADFAIPKTCRGRPFSVNAVPRYPTEVTTAFAAVPEDDRQTSWGGPLILAPGINLTRLPDADVCFYSGSTLLKCHERRGVAEMATSRGNAESSGQESGVIPSNATSARVFMGAGAHAVWVFNAV